jgi:hypothetical protein
MPIWMLRLEPHGVWAGQPAGRVPHSPSPRSYPSSRWRHRSGPQNLQAHVLIDRPENVREYMIEYLSNMKKVRAAHRRAGLIATDYVSCDRSPALLRACVGTAVPPQDEEGQFDPELVPSSVRPCCWPVGHRLSQVGRRILAVLIVVVRV